MVNRGLLMCLVCQVGKWVPGRRQYGRINVPPSRDGVMKMQGNHGDAEGTNLMTEKPIEAREVVDGEGERGGNR